MAKLWHQEFSGSSDSSINLLKDVQLEEVPRIRSGTSELDLVLGGGFVPGSCVLLGGEPGAVRVPCFFKHFVLWLNLTKLST